MANSQPTPLFGEREALAFLRMAFGGLPEARYVVLWELAGKQSVSFQDLEKAAAWAGDRNDVYVHVGIADRSVQGGHRIKALEVAGIVGCWADIDVADPVHKKEGLPETEAIALSVARSTGLEPSILVHSGHGLQAWWLLNEPWLFESSDERRRAALLVRAWDLSLRARAKHLGWTLDAVGDLSRLLRIPGTRNCKALPTVVRIEASSDVRYSLDDLEAALVEDAWQQAERELGGTVGFDRPADDGDLVLNPTAEPPFELMMALLDNEPRFHATWTRTRRDAKGWSASEYDLALARFAALAGWSRQQIANLLVASRRKHGDDLKLRQDYYGNTIDKARSDQVERELVNEAVAMAEEVRQAPTNDGPPVNRVELLERISAAIGVKIDRLLKSRGEPPVFRIETPFGSGVLGGIGVLISNHKFREKVGEVTNRLPKRLKNEHWDPLAQALLQTAELEELGLETTVKGRAETWLSLYLGDRQPARLEQLDERTRGSIAQGMPPFIGDDGRIRIFGTGFRRWLIEVQHELLTANEVGSLLRTYGCESETKHFRTPTGRTSRSLWVLPSRDESDADDGRSG